MIIDFLFKLFVYIFVIAIALIVILFIPALIYVVIALIQIVLKNPKREKNNLNKIDKTKFKNYEIDLKFDFKCEYCDSIINTNNKTCPNCNGAYDKNKEYLKIKQEKYKEYYDFLNNQEKELTNEIEIFHKMQNIYKKKSFAFKHRAYNYDIDYDYIEYEPKDNHDFVCDFCGTKLNGTSHDNKKCSNCGASYNNNIELLALEKKEQIIKENNEVYNIIQKNKETINKDNINKDNKEINSFNKKIKIIGTIVKIYFILFSIIIVLKIIKSVLNAIG